MKNKSLNLFIHKDVPDKPQKKMLNASAKYPNEQPKKSKSKTKSNKKI